MNTMVAPADWNAVDFMVDVHSRPRRLGLLSETLAWVASVALFREAETQTHDLKSPTTEDRRHQRPLLAALRAEGQRLLQRAHAAGGLPENLDGITTADLDAMVEELRTTQLQWEGDMTSERRGQILTERFEAPSR
jgi:hypothetical protein